MKLKYLDEATDLVNDAARASMQLVNNERAVNQLARILFEIQHDLREPETRLPTDLTSLADRILRTLEFCGLIEQQGEDDGDD